ncbi:MAG: 4-hydroxy-3-methylbut-2-enyl diphosphate reductase [Rikenellaceae bacterium]
MRVEIDPKSGFCFGVVRAITEAERALSLSGGEGEIVYSLGDIVHNRIEVQRLEGLGLLPISSDEMSRAMGRRLLIRAHGEPPVTYLMAKELGIEIIDATCPVVSQLQQRVVRAYEMMREVGGTVVLLGKRGHAEVVGLTGQVEDRVWVVEREEDLEGVDFTSPIYFLSQTTQSISLFNHLAEVIRGRASEGVSVEVCDTICRQVSSREGHLREFVSGFDLVIFVCGRKSSNGKVLFELCREANPNCYNIESEEELRAEWIEGVKSVGICGATSTPAWLMERVAASIETI